MTSLFKLGAPSLGTGAAHYADPDPEELRFWPHSDLGSFLTLPRLERWSGDIVASYERLKSGGRDWAPIPTENRRLVVLFESICDRALPPPPCLVTALAFALGIEADVRRALHVLDAALRRAEADVVGSPQSDAEIAAAIGISARKLAMLKNEPEYAGVLAVGRANFVPGNPLVNVFPGDELFPNGDEEWQSRRDAVAEDIIRQRKLEGTRFPSIHLRLSVWALVSWHATHQRPISPNVLKAVAWILGLVHLKTGRLIRRVNPAALAEEDARAIVWHGKPESAASVAKRLGVSRVAILKIRAENKAYKRVSDEPSTATNK